MTCISCYPSQHVVDYNLNFHIINLYHCLLSFLFTLNYFQELITFSWRYTAYILNTDASEKLTSTCSADLFRNGLGETVICSSPVFDVE